MVLYEVMKFCNLADQSQFETSNLNSYWINTNNLALLGFWCLIMGTHGFPHGLLVNMSLFIL